MAAEPLGRVVVGRPGLVGDRVAHVGAERFDVWPLLVAPDDAIEEFGSDGRRL